MQQDALSGRSAKARTSRGFWLVWALFLGAFFGVSSTQSAHAQDVRIEAVNPLENNRLEQTGLESENATFRVVLANAEGNTSYRVTVETFDGDFGGGTNGAEIANTPRRNAIGEGDPITDARKNVPPTVAPNDTPPYQYLDDYFTKTQTFTFNGNGSQEFTVRVIDEKDYERIRPAQDVRQNQAFSSQITTTAQGRINGAAAGSTRTLVVTENRVDHFIIDNDARPDIAVAPVKFDAFDDPFVTPVNAFIEPDAPGGTPETRTNGVTVFLSARNQVEAINFNFNFSSGTGITAATEGTDFDNTFGSAVFLVGESVATNPANPADATPVGLDVRGDIGDETDEDVLVTLSGAATARVATVTGNVRILDNDAPAATISDFTLEQEPDTGQTAQATFNITLDQASPQVVNILYTVAPTTPGAGNDPAEELAVTNRVQDYTDPGTNFFINVQFGIGVVSQTITVEILGDNVDENDETFVVQLGRGGSNTRGVRFRNANGNFDNQGIGTIVDNDRPTFRLGTPLSIVEPAGGPVVLNFPVTLEQPSERQLQITASTQDQTATQPSDYQSNSQVLTFNPGVAGDPTQPPVQNRVFGVNINPDALDEIDETFLVNLSNANFAEVLTPTASTTGTITDNDGPQISIGAPATADTTDGDPAITEANVDTELVFPVTLSAPSPQQITVNYRTQDGTGANRAVSTGVNPDFQAETGTLTFAPNTLVPTTPLSITIRGNTTFESTVPETFTVILSVPTNADPTTPFGGSDGSADRATGTITEDDLAPVVTVDDPRVVEGGGAQFTIRLLNPSEQQIVVNYITTNGSATTAPPNPDFAQTQGAITFSPASVGVPADIEETVVVPTIADSIDETDETFNLNLSLASGTATFGNPVDTVGVATILDNDGPSISIATAATVAEGSSGSATNNLAFVLTITSADPMMTGSAQPITLNFSTSNGTATSPADFTGATNGTFTIPAGVNTFTLNVPVVGDLIDEENESFTLTLSNPDPLQATLTNSTSTATITDDDTAGVVVTPITNVTTEAGGTATFSVVLTSQPTAPVTISLVSSDATEGVPTPTSLTFTAGNFATAQTVTVTGRDDSFDDGNVAFRIVTTATSADAKFNNISVADVDLTNTDNDDATLTLTLASPTVAENGAGVTATVTRNVEATPQTTSLEVTISNSAPTQVSVPTTVTIAAGAASATFVITPINDNIVDGNQTATITASAGNLSDSENITVNDDDVRRLDLTVNTSSAREGEANIIGTVTRNTVGNANNTPLTVTLVSSNPSQATVPAQVIIPAGRSSVNFNITPVDDNFAEDGQNVTITASTSAADGFEPNSILIAVNDNDDRALSLTITPNTIREDGDPATGVVRRNTSDNSARLTVTLTSAVTNEATVPNQVIIAAGSDTASFSVTPVDDGIVDGSKTFNITASASDSVAPFESFRSALAPVTVTDTDLLTLTLTVSSNTVGESGSIEATVSRNTEDRSTALDIEVSVSNGSLTVPQRVTIPAGRDSVNFEVLATDDSIASGRVRTQLTVRVPNVSSDNEEITITDNDIAKLSLALRSSGSDTDGAGRLEEGGTDIGVVARNTPTDSALSVTLISDNPRIVVPRTVEIPAGQTSVQFIVRALDDSLPTGDASVIITATAGALTATKVVLLNEDDRGTIIVTPTTIRTEENGATATFTVRLGFRPSNTVTIPLRVTRSRSSLLSNEVTLSANSLVFTAADFNTAQTVTVTSRDDNDADGTVAFTVNLLPAISNDQTFAGVDAADVNGQSIDNDRAGFIISPVNGLITTENGASARFNVRLTSRPLDAAGVSVAFTSSDTSEGIPTTGAVRFTQANYQRGIDISVRGVNDNLADGDQPFTVRISLIRSLDPAFARITPASLPAVNITNRDDEEAALALISRSSLVTTENGGTATVFVRLQVRPSSNVTVRVASSDPLEGTVSPAVLTFTPQNFFTAQSVTVRGVDDNEDDGDQTFQVTATAVARGSVFDGLQAEPLTLTNRDNDDKTPPIVTITGLRDDGVVLVGTVNAITGTATDASEGGSGVRQVEIQLTRVAGGQTTYLRADGTFGVTPPTSGVFVNTNTVGQFRLPLSAPLAAGSYTLTVSATDTSGNTSAEREITFVVTDTPVSIVISTPTNGQTFTSVPAVTGTFNSATGPSDVSSVRVLVRLGSRTVRTFTGTSVVLRGNTFTTTAIGNLPDGVYTIEATATDRLGNVARTTSTFRVDKTAPVSVAITSPANNSVVDTITQISGTVSDGTSGSGVTRVELVIIRRTDGKFFNGTSFVEGPATATATVTGNTFTFSTRGSFPADPDPLNAAYTIQPIAFDAAGNRTAGAAVLVFLSSNRSRPGVTAASVSGVKLSTSTVSAATASVTLNFTGALNAASAIDVANYQVVIDGQSVEIEGAAMRGNVVSLGLPEGAAKSGSAVVVNFNLLDAQSRVLRGTAKSSTR